MDYSSFVGKEGHAKVVVTEAHTAAVMKSGSVKVCILPHSKHPSIILFIENTAIKNRGNVACR